MEGKILFSLIGFTRRASGVSCLNEVEAASERHRIDCFPYYIGQNAKWRLSGDDIGLGLHRPMLIIIIILC